MLEASHLDWMSKGKKNTIYITSHNTSTAAASGVKLISRSGLSKSCNVKHKPKHIYIVLYYALIGCMAFCQQKEFHYPQKETSSQDSLTDNWLLPCLKHRILIQTFIGSNLRDCLNLSLFASEQTRRTFYFSFTVSIHLYKILTIFHSF